jgi:hypothetical protein
MRLITGENSVGTGSRCGSPQRERVVGHRDRRRPAAMTDLDVTAAGISLPVGELWHRLCSGGLVTWGTRPGGRQCVETVAR